MSIAPFVSYLVGRRSNNRRSSFSCYTYNRASAVDNVLCGNHFHGRNILTGLRLDVLYILAKIELCLIFPGVEVLAFLFPRIFLVYLAFVGTTSWNSLLVPSRQMNETRTNHRVYSDFSKIRENIKTKVTKSDQSNQSVTFHRNFILRNLMIFCKIYERNFAFLFIFK